MGPGGHLLKEDAVQRLRHAVRVGDVHCHPDMWGHREGWAGLQGGQLTAGTAPAHCCEGCDSQGGPGVSHRRSYLYSS
jgi:hypothetical protein